MDQRRPDNKLAELSDLTVLIVDDDDDCRELLATLLETRHAKVICASSAQEALAKLSERPDVIVSDIAMPGEDGYSFMRQLRALPPDSGGRTPSIAVTAFTQLRDRHDAYSAGFTRHLPKPVDLTELCIEISMLGRVHEHA